MSQATGPVCVFCARQFSLAAGAETPCPHPAAEAMRHVERRLATHEDYARIRRVEASVDTKHPMQKAWEQTDAYKEAAGSLFGRSTEEAKKEPAPTPFDADALRAGAPNPQMGFGI